MQAVPVQQVSEGPQELPCEMQGGGVGVGLAPGDEPPAEQAARRSAAAAAAEPVRIMPILPTASPSPAIVDRR